MRPILASRAMRATNSANLSRWRSQEEIRLETVRDVYRALQSRLGRGSGLVAPDALQQELFGEGFDADSRLRVAISMLEKAGLVRGYVEGEWFEPAPVLTVENAAS